MVDYSFNAFRLIYSHLKYTRRWNLKITHHQNLAQILFNLFNNRVSDIENLFFLTAKRTSPTPSPCWTRTTPVMSPLKTTPTCCGVPSPSMQSTYVPCLMNSTAGRRGKPTTNNSRISVWTNRNMLCCLYTSETCVRGLRICRIRRLSSDVTAHSMSLRAWQLFMCSLFYLLVIHFGEGGKITGNQYINFERVHVNLKIRGCVGKTYRDSKVTDNLNNK